MDCTATVWLLDCRGIGDEEQALWEAGLGPSETQRLARFVRAERRRQFVAGRALLRQALGELLSISPARVHLIEQPGNAPLLDLPNRDNVGFSLSHSGHWVACAVSLSSRLGLDVEIIDASRNIDELAAQAFDATESEWLSKRPEQSRTRDFYNLWSAKEARYKLHSEKGECVYLPHDQLAIALCTEQHLMQVPLLELRSLDSAPLRARVVPPTREGRAGWSSQFQSTPKS